MSVAPNYVGSFRVTRTIRSSRGRSDEIVEAVNDMGERCFLKSLVSKKVNRSLVAELRREHEVAGSFDHPNATRVGPVATSNGTYVSLDIHPEGHLTTLNNLSSSQLPESLSTVVVQAAQGLEYLHSQGWVHATLKPAAFLIDATGHTWLTDFGQVHPVKASFFSRLLRRDSRGVQAPAYASPELIRGESLDERADVYSFGCLLFHLLTGKPPYSGATPKELLQKHLRAPIPRLRSREAGLPVGAAEAVERMLSKSRKDRPENMAEVTKSIRALRAFRPSGAA